MGDLRGMVAIVTGATRGIGLATARLLAVQGVTVVLAARNVVEAQAVAGDIRHGGGRALAVRCDVSRFDDVRRVVKYTEQEAGSPDILVNNAAVIEPMGPLEGADPLQWAHNISVNLVGAFYGCRAVLPGFLERGRGVIVNVSSGAAHRPVFGWSAYCSGKAGLAMLTRAIHLEVGERGVRVYGFQPGYVDTDMQAKIRTAAINEIARVPKEQLVDPVRPARVVAWLCTEEARDLAGRELAMADDERLRAAAEMAL